MAVAANNNTKHIRSIALKGVSKRMTSNKPYIIPEPNAGSPPVRGALDVVLYFLGRDDEEYVRFGISGNPDGAIARQKLHNRDWARAGRNFDQVLALVWATKDDEQYLKTHWGDDIDIPGETEMVKATPRVKRFLKNLRYNPFVAVDFHELPHLPRVDASSWLPKKYDDPVTLKYIHILPPQQQPGLPFAFHPAAKTPQRIEAQAWSYVLEAEPTDDDFWTSEIIINAARAAMGSIDLDPASCRFANKNIRANKIFTQYDSGLDHDWFGNVWVNPPFKITTKFVHHAIAQLTNINQMCFFCTTDAAGNISMRKLLRFSSATCVVERKKRNRCWGPKATGGGPSHFVMYIGDNPQGFCNAFSEIGFCSYAHNPSPRSEETAIDGSAYGDEDEE